MEKKEKTTESRKKHNTFSEEFKEGAVKLADSQGLRGHKFRGLFNGIGIKGL